jgi:hypothetical protein
MLFDSNKSKQYLLLALKVLILMVIFGYIYVKLIQVTSLPFKDFIANLSFDRRSALFLFLTGLSISSVLNYLWKIEIGLKMKMGIYSIIRYFIFSFLCYLLLVFFGAEIPFSETISLLCSMNLLVSMILSIFILDFVVRVGVAICFFSLVGVSKLTILSTVLSIGFLNFVFPSILGSFYVPNYKLVTR